MYGMRKGAPGNRARGRWMQIHRWLGLALLVFWVLMGLSGSVLVVYRELLNAGRPVPAAHGHSPHPSISTPC